jgi:DNA-binding XRE family transcriptional regulator
MTSKELKAWRQRNNYSQSQLARNLDVATQTVYRWENDKRKITPFLHLALECLEKKGGKGKAKGKKMEKKREVKK